MPEADIKHPPTAATGLESTTDERRSLLIFSACSNPYGNPFLKNKTENILKRGFSLERTKFFEASMSDTLSRSNQLQSRLMPNHVTFFASPHHARVRTDQRAKVNNHV